MRMLLVQTLLAAKAINALIKNGRLPEKQDFTALAQNKIVCISEGMGAKDLKKIKKRTTLLFYLKSRVYTRYLKLAKQFVYAFKKVVPVFLAKNIIAEQQGSQ